MPRSAEKPPKFLIRSSAGKVNHLFSIDPNSVESVLKILEGSSSSVIKKAGSQSTPLFGSISADGCLQIWDLLKRRPILTLDTHLPTTSWADLCPRIPLENEESESTVPSPSDLEFFLYSRKSGLFRQTGDTLRKNSLVRLPLEDVHCGFCKPLLISSEMLICPCGSDSIANISEFNSEQPTVEQISTSGPVTFLQNIPGTQSRILLGTEDGKVSLLDTTSSTVIASCNLNEFVTESSEGSLVPLCSDGDETTGHYLVGTAAEELILVELQILPENESQTNLSVSKVIKVHRRGTSCIKLRPDKILAVVAGWDTRLRLFNFPGLKQLATLSCHSMTVSSLLFLPIPVGGGERKSDQDLEQEGSSTSGSSGPSKSLTSTGGVGGHYLLSASHDSTVAVWDDFGK